ncbi:MAG: RDD family protein [Ardenticatenaceae bacterium]|nr:RDD family protein [Ardenticatenaceae bacterium]MCB8975403.1 RDD family protein [Ardenticatenaceae bacterium]
MPVFTGMTDYVDDLMTTPDEFLNIDTPENVVFGYEVVGIGSRFLAALIDTAIIGLLLLAANAILILVLLGGFDALETINSFLVALLSLISFAFFWGYYIFFEMRWNGSSPGKQQVGIRVIRADGTPITLAESVIRNLVRLVDFLPGAYGLGLVTMFIDSKARRLGDLAANTLVVREQTAVSLESLQKATAVTSGVASRAPGKAEMEAAKWPVEKLTEADIQLAESLLQRYNDLPNGFTLANQILNRLLERMEMPVNPVRPSDAIYAIKRIVQIYHYDR